jgi:hypothetical protein
MAEFLIAHQWDCPEINQVGDCSCLQYQVTFPNGNILDVATHRVATDVLRISIGFYERLIRRKLTDDEFDGWNIVDLRSNRYVSFLL